MIPLTLLAIALLGAVGDQKVWKRHGGAADRGPGPAAGCSAASTRRSRRSSGRAAGCFRLGIARWLAAIALLGLTVAVVVPYGAYRPRSTT